jgi:hypothetical protein
LRGEVFFQTIEAGVPKLLVFQNPARYIAQRLRVQLEVAGAQDFKRFF